MKPISPCVVVPPGKMNVNHSFLCPLMIYAICGFMCCTQAISILIKRRKNIEDYWFTVFSDEKPYCYDSEGYILKNTEFLMI
jgi:hypothetical protein